MVLVIDNYDSFTYNLVQYLGELGAEVRVMRNDTATVNDVAAAKPDRIVISPGPGRPEQAGITMDVIKQFGSATPILGVCLGHQAIGAVFGGAVVRAGVPMHGKTSTIEHDGRGVFRGIAGRSSPRGTIRWSSPRTAAGGAGGIGADAGRRDDHGAAAPDVAGARRAVSSRVVLTVREDDLGTYMAS
jgi:anthranilate synthase/aminodeoxychorismate synthase-like glutamine amidotransferase